MGKVDRNYKLYRIRNLATQEQQDIGAESMYEACQKLGWAVGDCQVKIILDPDKTTGVRVVSLN